VGSGDDGFQVDGEGNDNRTDFGWDEFERMNERIFIELVWNGLPSRIFDLKVVTVIVLYEEVGGYRN
jgi:hypothetical protein